MSTIQIEDVIKGWGRARGVNGLSARIERGSLVALLGPSGSGKTTLLRILGGLETMDSGRVLFDGEDVSRLGPAERGVGFVFQSYALFRHLSAFENVAFGLRVRPRKTRPSNDAIRARTLELLSRVGLDAYAERLPHELSGGQRQRVALARALAVEPRILLLDEPFGALDARVRVELRRWLRDLHDQLGLTTVLVTHDQEEAIELADDVIVLDHGRIEHHGSPRSLVDAPSSPFARAFVGDARVFEASVGPRGEAMLGSLSLGEPRDTSDLRVVLRPSDSAIHERSEVEPNGTIRHVVFFADRVKVTVTIDDGPDVLVGAPRGSAFIEGLAKHQRVRLDASSRYRLTG